MGIKSLGNMKNKIIFKISITIFSLFFAVITFAEDTPPVIPVDIHLKIISSKTSFYDANISVNACDSDNNIATPDIMTPYCAIKQLEKLETPVLSNWSWSDSYGYYINSIGDIVGYTDKDKNGDDEYHYWSWLLNEDYALVGLSQYELKKDDSILLSFVPIEEEIVEEVPPPKHSSSGSYITNFIQPVVITKVFSIDNALKFLKANQQSDGSYGAAMYTDWVAVAAGAGDDQEIKSKLINYLKENDIDSLVVTDNERRAMALMSLGINPYNETKVNYIKKITDSFDGVQFGDKTLVNDDIFALIILKNAGYSTNDELIINGLNYIISKQNKEGSWGSIDMTAAGIQALKSFRSIVGVDDAILKAGKYIITNQKTDGGLENSSSTSWALQALFENEEVLKGEAYLASKQDIDGGMEGVETDLNTRIWATAYAIPAILHKPWAIILNSFSKPDINILTLNKNEIIKQNKKITPKISNVDSVEIIKSIEDKKKIENIVDSNGEVKINKSSNIWKTIGVSFGWLLGKLGF